MGGGTYIRNMYCLRQQIDGLRSGGGFKTGVALTWDFTV